MSTSITRGPQRARVLAASLALDLFGRLQQTSRAAWPFDLDHLVQEPRLVFDTPRLGLDDTASADQARALLTQAAPRRAQVAIAAPEVGAEPEIGDRHRRWSAVRTTRVISSTSCTRTASAPRSTAAPRRRGGALDPLAHRQVEQLADERLARRADQDRLAQPLSSPQPAHHLPVLVSRLAEADPGVDDDPLPGHARRRRHARPRLQGSA